MEIRTRIVAGALAVLASWPVLADDSAALHRHLSVTGEGEVAVKPDRARLHLGVTQVNADLSAAQNAVNAVVRDYLAAAKSLGAKEEQISTAGVSINPEYVWDDKEKVNRLVGYRVSRDMDVRIDNLDKIGDFVLRATKAGVNQVQAPVLESSKAKEIQQQAMVKATQDAQAKAKLLADTLGVKLGPVHNLTASETNSPPPMPKVMAMRAMASDASGNSEMGFSAGEIRYGAQVNADFELIVP